MFSLININDRENWNQIIKGFKEYDAYYLAEYVKAFELHGDGEPGLFYYEDQNLKAANVIMIQDIANDPKLADVIPKGEYYDIKTPYGYGGFLIEGQVTPDNINKLNEEYISMCNKLGVISEFVRFHPVLKNSSGLEGMYDTSELGRTITMNLDSPNQIWNELSSKNRNVIRKAIKNGVEIFWGRDNKLFDKFVELYNSTMDRDNAKDYYYFNKTFYESVAHDLKYHSMLFYAMYNGKIIAMSIVLFANKQLHYHLSASDKEYLHLAPTNLLLYEVACWGSENGYETFHLGGGLGSNEDSLYKFKKSFNKNSDTVFTIGKKIFNDKKYNELVHLRQTSNSFDPGLSFFPRYRL